MRPPLLSGINMANNEESKYVQAIRKLGRPSSPQMIRFEVNKNQQGTAGMVTPQNVASALKNLLDRGRISRGVDGLYSVKEES